MKETIVGKRIVFTTVPEQIFSITNIDSDETAHLLSSTGKEHNIKVALLIAGINQNVIKVLDEKLTIESSTTDAEEDKPSNYFSFDDL
jgi:hypothetical protein